MKSKGLLGAAALALASCTSQQTTVYSTTSVGNTAIPYGIASSQGPVLHQNLGVSFEGERAALYVETPFTKTIDSEVRGSELWSPSIGASISNGQTTGYLELTQNEIPGRPDFSIGTLGITDRSHEFGYGFSAQQVINKEGVNAKEGRIFSSWIDRPVGLEDNLWLHPSVTINYVHDFPIKGNGFSTLVPGIALSYQLNEFSSLTFGATKPVTLEDFDGVFKDDTIFTVGYHAGITF